MREGFLKSTRIGSYLTVGILTMFLFGILWKPSTASSCVFRSKVATRFGLKWPPNSEQRSHPFRSESGRFLAAAETGGRHVPK